MRFPVMSAADATAYLFNKRAGSDAKLDHLVKQRGEGKELSLDFVDPLREELESIREQFPQGLRNQKDGNRFEALAARAVHEAVPNYPEVVGDPEFWIWLAVVHCRELVEWRYGNPAEGTGLANYGIGARVENLLYRSWLRAELLLDEEADDRYHLSEAGQIDFYRSHLFRQGYANARNFARALLRFQYPNKDLAAPNLKVGQIRELVKRLRRLRANLFLEILEEAECRKVIEAEASVVATSA
jgi:Family of unknown function (DUF6339)